MSGVPVPIAAPGFRDELKGPRLGLGLTPHTHPIGMLALSVCRDTVDVRTSLHLIDAIVRRARRESTHCESLSQQPPWGRGAQYAARAAVS